MSKLKPDGHYHHRHADEGARHKFIDHHVTQLLGLQRATDPSHGEATAPDKDKRARAALQTAGNLVEALAGWAIDHMVGLGLDGQAPLAYPIYSEHYTDYADAKAAADDHRHEALGSMYDRTWVGPDALDASHERQVLINLLQANPGAFPWLLGVRTATALEALELGEAQRLLRPAVSHKTANAHSRRESQIQALEDVAYLVGAGKKKSQARRIVAYARNCSPHTLKSWESRLQHLDLGLRLDRARQAGATDSKKGRGGPQDDKFGEYRFSRYLVAINEEPT